MKAITLTIFFNRRFRHSPFLFILLLCSSSAFSASISWDGGGGTDKDWSNPLNWSGDVVPGSTDQVTITGVYTPTITSNVGTINQLILNTSSTGSPRLVISTLGSLGVTNLTTTNQNQVTLQGGAIENSGTLTITTGGNTTNNTSKGLVFINGSGAFISAASYSGSGTLTINTSAASNIGSCINFSQTNANPVLTVGGTLNFVAASNQYVIVATNGTNALINGTGTISAGTSGSTVTFGLINVNSSNIASTLTVDSGVILNSYSTGFSNSSGSIVLGSTIGNTFINKGVLNIGGSGGNGIYCAPTAITNNLSNEGTINLSGAFSYSIIRFGGTGTSNFTNSGTINIDNIPSTSTGIGMSAAPTVNINNTGSLVFGASGTNSAAITLGDSKVVFNNTGTVTINKGYLIGTSGTGKASFNNNTNGVFRSNVGNSNTGISTNITFTNSGGTFEGSCAITAGSFIPSTGTLSPGGSTGIGMIIFYTTAGGATFNLTGKCFMNVNGKTTAGTDYDQIMTSTPLSTLDVSGATLEMVLGGAYSPATGDNIPLFVGATARTGKFSSQTLPTSWTMDYTATTAAKVLFSTYVLIYENIFNNYLDTLDWKYRTGWRYDGLSLPQNVYTANSCLNIDFKKEIINGVNTLTSGGVISKKCFGYGYYEVKSKTFGRTAGLHTSFWIMGSTGDGIAVPKYNQVLEIDGYEIDSDAPNDVMANLHYYIGNHVSIGATNSTLVNTSNQFVTHGFEWTPTSIKWYTNGTLIRTFNNPQYYAPQNLWLTALGTTQFAGTAGIDTTKLPGTSSWEYFRYYAKDMGGYNWVGNNDFEYNTGTGFTTEYTRDLQFPVSWSESGQTSTSFIVKDSLSAYSGKCFLKHQYSQPYSVMTMQHLDYIPNGVYMLKAWVRSSGGQATAQLMVADIGSSSCSVDIHAASSWTQVSLNNIVVDNNSCTIAVNSVASANQWLDVDSVEFIQQKSGFSPQLIKDPSFDNGLIQNNNPTVNHWSSGIGYISNTIQPNSSASLITDNDNNNYFRCNMTENNTDYTKWYLANLAQLTTDTVKAGNYLLKIKLRTTIPTDSTYIQLKISSTTDLGSSIITGIQNNSPEITWVEESSTSTSISRKQLRIKPTNIWKEYLATLSFSPITSSPIRVYFMFPRKGEFDLDDISLEKIISPMATSLFTANPLTRAANSTESELFKVYSYKGAINIQSPNDAPISVEVYTIMGLLVLKKEFVGSTQINLRKGIYIVHAASPINKIVRKVIIQ